MGEKPARDGGFQALLDADPRFRRIFEQSPLCTVLVGLDGRFLLVNSAWCELLGYTEQELLSLTVRDVTHPEDCELHADLARRLREGEIGSYRLEKRYLHKDGHVIWGHLGISIVRDELGEPLYQLAQIEDVSERQRTEDALQQSEARFRSAFASAAIGMAIVAPDGRFIQVNDALCELYGYSAGELLEMTYLDITHPDDFELHAEPARRLREGEIGSYDLEKRYLHRNGDVVWARLSVSSVRDREGRVLYDISQVQDITDQKRAEHASAEAAARLAEAQQLAQLGSWDWSLETDTIIWSDELFRIYGFESRPETLTFEMVRSHTHPDDLEIIDANIARACEDGQTFTWEHRILLPDGSLRWVSGLGEVEFRDGVAVRMHGTAQDITERKEAEESLRQAELRYRTLLEQLPLGTYVRPLDMSVPNVYCSPQVEPILGYSAEDWMNDPTMFERTVHPDDLERAFEAARRLRETGEPIHMEYRFVKKDGRTVWVQDETYLGLDENGRPCVRGFLLDITERKEAEEERDRLVEELHRAQKLEAVGRLAGGVAHDFNNMLTAIRGYAELLVEGLDPGTTGRRHAEQIARAADQAAALPRQLLAFSRKQVLQPVLLDLDQVVSDASDLLSRLLHESIDFAIVRPTTPVPVLADPAQVEQVLLNLAVNARDAMPDGGKLTIATGVIDVGDEVAAEHEVAPGRYAAITVADDGDGMDAETQARIFEPFFTTKGAAEGSGLGLATVYGIVRQSEGFVRVESLPAAGATFEVCFPLAVGDQAPVVPREPEPAVTVLLAEDEEIVRELASTALEQAGYGIVTATSGLEALAYCESPDAPVDVLLTDMVMPGMGGRELAERLVAERPGTPVVLMSGYTADPPSLRVEGGGAVTFLQKPFTPRTLAQAVGDAIQRSGANGNGKHAPRPDAVTCLVADDHPGMLDSISRLLEREGFAVVLRASRAEEALEGIEKLKPALALLDVSMGPLSGIDVTRRVAASAPATRVVLYTGHSERGLVEQAFDAGARGFVLKEAPLSELVRALRVVANDGTYVDSELSAVLTSQRAPGRPSPLTKREQEILCRLADGMTNDRVASALGISAETVQSHVRNAMTKLDAHTRTEAVATALRQSLIR